MACLMINEKFAVIDCPSCRGAGNFTIIGSQDGGPPTRNEACGVCTGVGLVRIPIEDIPIVNLGSDYIEDDTMTEEDVII